MIRDVDETLKALIRRDAVKGNDVEVVFDAPTKEWAARRNAPTVDVYLYDIREDMKWRSVGVTNVKDDEGKIVARHGPPRFFKLSYLITAWTQLPEEEHGLLSDLLRCFLRFDRLPPDLLPEALSGGPPVRLTIATPPPEDRALSDTWSALGGELKPSLDLVVSVPVDPLDPADVAPLVQEEPHLTVSARGAGRPGGPDQRETAGGRRRPATANGGGR